MGGSLGSPGGLLREERDPLMPGRVLFRADATVDALNQRLREGARIRSTKLTEQFGAGHFAAQHPGALPMFVWTPEQQLQVVTTDNAPALRPGCTVLSLVPADGGS